MVDPDEVSVDDGLTMTEIVETSWHVDVAGEYVSVVPEVEQVEDLVVRGLWNL